MSKSFSGSPQKVLAIRQKIVIFQDSMMAAETFLLMLPKHVYTG